MRGTSQTGRPEQMVNHDGQLTCAGCGSALALDVAAGAIRTLAGVALGLTYLDTALAVWDCPTCGRTDAARAPGRLRPARAARGPVAAGRGRSPRASVASRGCVCDPRPARPDRRHAPDHSVTETT